MFARFKERGLSPLFVIVTLIIVAIVLPSVFIFIRLFHPVTESWLHIKEYVLADYIHNSLVLVAGVSVITGILGTFFAWSLSKYQWRFGLLLESLLFLPMAIPPYIAGYVYGGIFTPFGTLDRILNQVGKEPIRVDILSKGGAIFVFSLFLTPDVFLVTKVFFEKLPKNIEESSRLLGRNQSATFFRVILPMSRGALVGGIVLVMLEVLNDYGLVRYFGIPTFSTAIYQTWFGMSDVDGAVRLAASLMSIVIIILLMEQFFRGRGRLSQARAISDGGIKKRASKVYKVVFYVLTFVYLSLALILPITQLVWWSSIAKQTNVMRRFGSILFNTISVGVIVTILVVVCGILIGNLNRLNPSILSKIYARIVILGYSVPASIIAIGVLVTFISVDRSLSGLYGILDLKNLFLTSSKFILIFALTIRFMAIGFNSIESGFSKMGKKHYEASKLLGRDEWYTFRYVDFPILKPAIISAAIFAFVDVLKELPLTLILRPFNFDTLATRVFTYAGDEMIHEASVYSLIIIGVSIVALILLSFIRKGTRI
ncbi:ABC transporter permease [Petrocella sp. FN5]|uniref:ABC transporter permease n=1 Tax=Petrocella sp. FN5 TaxID=3032002 RepID=UPI0023D97DA9|nr:iron ABC transporter permease [Petrocella sp. FN5]MDF1616933.1 iron ABC transporter permease [Petrocella sp. FN5]